MSVSREIFVDKLSLPGKINDELSYVFADDPIEHKNSSIVLFGVFHCLAARELYHTIIKSTVKHYLDFFHRMPPSVAASLEHSLNDSGEFLFESAIQYTSEKVTNAILELQDGDTTDEPFQIKNIHCMLGALIDDVLFLNITGTIISAYYVYPVFQNDNFSHYAMIPIVDARNQEPSQRLFANVVSGKVGMNGGTIVACNEAFLEYISPEQLKQSIMTRPIETIIDSFQASLGKISAKRDFSAVVLQPNFTPSPHLSKAGAGRHQTASNRSMESLITTERGTDTIMSPQIAKSMAGIMRSFVFSLIVPLFQFIIKTFRSIPYKKILTNVYEFGKNTLTGISAASRHVRTNGMPAIELRDRMPRFPKISFRISFEHIHRTLDVAAHSVGDFIRDVRHRGFKAFGTLSLRSKSLFILSIIFLFLFIQSIVGIKHQQDVKRQAAVSAEIVRALEDRFNAAEASLVYDDGDRARAVLVEAQSMIDTLSLSQQSKGFDAILAKEQSRMQLIRQRIDKYIVITNPPLIGELVNQIPSLSNLTMHANARGIFFAASDGIYSFKDGKATLIDTQAKIPSIGCVALGQKIILVCNQTGDRLYGIDYKDHTIEPLAIDRAPQENLITRITLYNDNLYVLDPVANALFRHQKKANGFTVGANWIKDPSLSIAGAKTFAVDGTVLIALESGRVLQLKAGKPNTLPLPLLQPPLGVISKIATDTDGKILFLLDSAQKRIISLEKDTLKLRGQIASDAFGTLTDIALLPGGRDLLILDQNGKVFKIPTDIK